MHCLLLLILLSAAAALSPPDCTNSTYVPHAARRWTFARADGNLVCSAVDVSRDLCAQRAMHPDALTCFRQRRGADWTCHAGDVPWIRTADVGCGPPTEPGCADSYDSCVAVYYVDDALTYIAFASVLVVAGVSATLATVAWLQFGLRRPVSAGGRDD